MFQCKIFLFQIKNLPILFVSEDNLFSVYSPLNVRQSNHRSYIEIAKALGVSSAQGDGNDIVQVQKLADQAMTFIRDGKGPFFLEFKTYRWREHCGPNFDNDLGYREESEFLKWKKRCPIETTEKQLLEEGYLKNTDVKKMREEIAQEIEEAFLHAKSSPFPEINSMFENIYANETQQAIEGL